MSVLTLLVTVDDGSPITFAEFCRINEIDEDEALAIRNALFEDGLYDGGGGAQAEFTLKIFYEDA